jgi:hypothetical protein
MPIPPLDEHGFLPVGIHDCSLEEVKARFGSFQVSDRRPGLFQKLQALVAEARAAGFARSLLIDGSFVTAKPDPNDIDLVLVLPLAHDLAADLPPAQYNLVSKRRVQKRYGFDIVAVRENTLEFDEAVAFFQQVRHQPNLRKGILRLLL